MKKYDEASVVRSLARKNSVNVDIVNNVVEVLKDATDVGNSTYGKIDYLCHYCGYTYIIVSSFKKKKIKKVTTENNDDKDDFKGKVKHLNMSGMVKNTMKKLR